jgi:hypothetical protein
MRRAFGYVLADSLLRRAKIVEEAFKTGSRQFPSPPGI